MKIWYLWTRRTLMREVLLGWSVSLGLFMGSAGAQTLPLPQNLINLNSDQGSALLQDSEALDAYWPLSIHFVTQTNQAFCGVASIVMVLNALEVPAPTTPEFDPYKSFTQDNVFTEATEKVLPQHTLRKMGMTLDQIGSFIGTYGVTTEVHHAADSSVEKFRGLAKEYLDAPGHYVIVNYLAQEHWPGKGWSYFTTRCLRCRHRPLSRT